MKGQIFDLQRFSIHNGPGIRTTVFFKGCNLRCLWCHNPESYLMNPQIRFSKDKCVTCGTCKKTCPKGLFRPQLQVQSGEVVQEKCGECVACAEACLYGALSQVGEARDAGQLMAVIKKDKNYYLNSGGGLTLSGGEPLLQPDFAVTLLKQAKEEGIHTALDTAGDVDFSVFEQVLPDVDLLLFDLKVMDEKQHIKYTGKSNERIIENLRLLFQRNTPIFLRIPLIKGVNDTTENAIAIKSLMELDKKGVIKRVEVLPYHEMGVDKGEEMGMEQKKFTAPDTEVCQSIQEIFEKKDEMEKRVVCK